MNTTSSLESWHNKFANCVGVKKPKFNVLINKLKVEQASNETLYQEFLDGHQSVSQSIKNLNIFEIVTKNSLLPYNSSNWIHLEIIAKVIGHVTSKTALQFMPSQI
ncbi:hypothetical protein DSO57_1014895 [Entomophthora muscae]|uniref:Uncharacterized protein n=1 Tax=Entomophthora muscae TaxID=34485 RepID=A0ACC2SI39_9FUNG|nr:hypothetical protein DSO57_1014895 [Entomophthora muscae]